MEENILIIEDISKDEVFKKCLSIVIKEVVKKRRERKPPPQGYKFNKDWYDIIDQSKLTSESFINEIPKIHQKKSKEKPIIRQFIAKVFEITVQSAIQEYYQANPTITGVMFRLTKTN